MTLGNSQKCHVSFRRLVNIQNISKMSKTVTWQSLRGSQVAIKELFGNYRKTGFKELQYERAAAEIRKATSLYLLGPESEQVSNIHS